MWKKWNISRHVQTKEAIWIFNYGQKSYLRQMKLFIYFFNGQQIRGNPPVGGGGGWDRRWKFVKVRDGNVTKI